MSSSSSIGTWSGRGFYPTTFSAQTTRGMANQWHHNHQSRQRGLDGLQLGLRRHREDCGVNTPIHSSGLSISSTIPWSICRNHASWHRSGICDWEDVSSGSSIWLPSLLCGRYLLELLSLKRLTEEIDNGGCRAGAREIPSVLLSREKRARGQPNPDKTPRGNSFLIRRSPSTMTSKNTTPVRCARSRFLASSTLRILSWPILPWNPCYLTPCSTRLLAASQISQTKKWRERSKVVSPPAALGIRQGHPLLQSLQQPARNPRIGPIPTRAIPRQGRACAGPGTISRRAGAHRQPHLFLW